MLARRPVVVVLWGTLAQTPWLLDLGAPVACVCSTVIVEPQLLLACQWMGLTLRLTGYEKWPRLQQISFCAGTDSMEWDLLSGALVPVKFALQVYC